MSDALLGVLTSIVSKVEGTTDLMITELTRYFLLVGVLHIVLVAGVTGFISRMLVLGIRGIDLVESSKQTGADRQGKMLLRGLQVVLYLGVVISCYSDLVNTIKILAAPHLFFIEKVRELTHK